jgi:hypothetical protein
MLTINRFQARVMLGLLLLSFMAILTMGAYIYNDVQQDRRIARNHEAQLRYLKARDGKQIADIRVEQLTKKEIEEAVGAVLKNMNIKAKNVNSYQETTIHAEKEIITRVEYLPSPVDSNKRIECINYSDSAYSISGCKQDSIYKLKFGVDIKLIGVNDRYREKWFQLKKKNHFQAMSTTPGVKITSLRVIEKVPENKFSIWRFLFR